MHDLVIAVSYQIRSVIEAGGIAIVPMFLLGSYGFFLLLQAFTQPGGFRAERLLKKLDDMITAAQTGARMNNAIDRNPMINAITKTLAPCTARPTPYQEGATRTILRERLGLLFYRMLRHLAIIRVLAAAAPLLGLLGTVSGLIRTFEAMHRFGFGNSGLLASGISEALMATQCGLSLAILLLLIGQFQEGRVMRLKDEMESRIAILLRCFFAKGPARE